MKSKYIMMSIAVAVLAAACQQQQPPDPRVAALAERQAIDQLVAGDYPRALDASDWDAYVATYTEDGELLLQGVSSKGRAAIKAFLAAQPAGSRINHVITNLSYKIDGDTAIGGRVLAGHRQRERRAGRHRRWALRRLAAQGERRVEVHEALDRDRYPPAGGVPAATVPSEGTGKP